MRSFEDLFRISHSSFPEIFLRYSGDHRKFFFRNLWWRAASHLRRWSSEIEDLNKIVFLRDFLLLNYFILFFPWNIFYKQHLRSQKIPFFLLAALLVTKLHKSLRCLLQIHANLCRKKQSYLMFFFNYM